MKVLRDPQILRGYLVEQPFDGWRAVTHCGEALCIRGHQLRGHSHPVFEFLLATGGRLGWLVGRREITQSAGDLFITFPRQPHETGPRPNPQNEHLWIGLDLRQSGPGGVRLARKLTEQRRQLIPNCGELEPLLRGVIAQAVSRGPRAEGIARRYVDLLMALIEQRFDGAPHPFPTLQASGVRSVPVQRALTYLEAHLDRRVPLDEIARVAAIRNLAYFCTRFRREVGLPPGEMHRRMRLEAAREALRRADASVTGVAHQFGFSSSQHFSGAFRSLFAVTPKSWRRRNTAVGHG